MATLERISHDLVSVSAEAGEEVITQGDQGDRFYLIEEGEVEVFEDETFRRNEGPGESFGEIALLRDVPRTATVRTTVPTRLLALEREQFISAVTGHRRSHQQASTVVESRWQHGRVRVGEGLAAQTVVSSASRKRAMKCPVWSTASRRPGGGFSPTCLTSRM